MIETMKRDILSVLDEETVYATYPKDAYSEMTYPRFLPLMRFYVTRYAVEGFGHLMIMHTKTKMGMELLTCSFMPKDGILLPYLLLDAMSMKKKRCVFVEYYGCGQEGLYEERLLEVSRRYAGLPDYPEKGNWYVEEREAPSLIKTGEAEELVAMAKDSVRAYLSSIKEAGHDPSYTEKLLDFREKMITQGNPSSATLERLLKKDGAVTFMKDVVMPQ